MHVHVDVEFRMSDADVDAHAYVYTHTHAHTRRCTCTCTEDTKYMFSRKGTYDIHSGSTTCALIHVGKVVGQCCSANEVLALLLGPNAKPRRCEDIRIPIHI